MSDKEEHHSSDNHKETHNDNDELEIKDDIDDIDTNIQPQEALEKLLGYMDKLSQDERNHLLANLIKNREVNPNKNIYYQARKKEILRERIRQRIEQKRNQRLPKLLIPRMIFMMDNEGSLTCRSKKLIYLHYAF
jgi:hypothetical protein